MSLRTTSRSRLLGMALLMATFVAGGLAGAAFTQVLEAREPSQAAAAAPECEERRHRDKGAIFEQLDLSPEQRARIDAIMKRRHAETSAFWENEGQRMKQIVDSTRAEIRAVLTPAQAAEYDRLREEHRSRRKAEHAERERARAAEGSTADK